MRYGLNNTTEVILLTAVVRDIGFENVTGMSLSKSQWLWSTADTGKQRDVVLVMLLFDSNVL